MEEFAWGFQVKEERKREQINYKADKVHFIFETLIEKVVVALSDIHVLYVLRIARSRKSKLSDYHYTE